VSLLVLAMVMVVGQGGCCCCCCREGGGRRGNFLFLFNLENLNFDFSYIFFNV
jgi:hypothetical protein